MHYQIGGIYTMERYQTRYAIIMIDKIGKNSVLYYKIPIIEIISKKDIENIINDQIRFKEIKFLNMVIAHIDFIKIDGYLGQVNENIIEKLNIEYSKRN